MANEWTLVDNTNWLNEHVTSFTTASEFVEHHSTVDWLTDEQLKKVYEIVAAQKPKKEKTPKTD